MLEDAGAKTRVGPPLHVQHKADSHHIGSAAGITRYLIRVEMTVIE